MKYIYYYYYYILVREFLKRWRLEQARIVSQYSRSFYTKVIKKTLYPMIIRIGYSTFLSLLKSLLQGTLSI